MCSYTLSINSLLHKERRFDSYHNGTTTVPIIVGCWALPFLSNRLDLKLKLKLIQRSHA